MNKAFLVSLMAVFVTVIAMTSVMAANTLNVSNVAMTVNGIELSSSDIAAGFAGETIPIKVVFTAGETASDARIKAEVTGFKDDISGKTERFKMLSGSTYSRTFSLTLPADIDLSEDYSLKVTIYTQDKEFEQNYKLRVQRDSYNVELLSIDSDNEVEAGSQLALDIVLKNRGYERLDDLFVIARIPELGVEKRAYFEDLTPKDENVDNAKDDSSERRMFLSIPQNAEEGVYQVEVIAYNSDTETTASKAISVTGTKAISNIIAPVLTKEISAGETKTYEMVLINRGKTMGVYEIAVESADNLVVVPQESIVTVPADSSKTVKIDVTAGDKKGTYSFAINVNSDGKNIKKQTFTANVVGNSTVSSFGNVTVLTVVLGIVFVVLLIVLIILLTRKPSKESLEESYY